MRLSRTQRFTAFVQREPLLFAVLVFAAAFFAYRWAVDLQRPGAQTPEGWRGFIDQGGYFTEALHLGRLEAIPAGEFAFGPGYPLLAAPFVRIGEHGWPWQDPFLPGNAAVWLLTVVTTYVVARRLYGEWTALACSLALMLATPLIGLVTLPWNTTATLGALMITLLVALSRRPVWWHGLVLGLAVAFAFSARYADAAWIAIAAVTIVIARGAFSRHSLGFLWGLASGAVLGVLPTLYLHWLAFDDPLETPYSAGPNQADASSFELSNIGPHALQTFVSPFFFDENGQRSAAQPLLSSMFILVFAPVGLWLLLRGSQGPRRILVLGYASASLASTVFYLAYWFTGSYGLTYGGIHFFKAWFPLWTIAGIGGLAAVVKRLQSWRAAGLTGADDDTVRRVKERRQDQRVPV